jgi:type I restriction enzyme S subunit
MNKDKLIPEVRFPEFVNDGEWVERTIEQIAKVSAGGTPESTNPEYWSGYIPWMNSGELNNKRIYSVSNFITKEGYENSSTKLIPPKCVLIGLAGQGKTRGTAAINYIELCTNQSIGSIHPNDTLFDSEFLYHKIDSMYDKLRSLSAGDGGRGGLNLQIIKEINISLPKINEQQKIASCLSSLDEAIAAHSQKLELLKEHKKGLMQNLFPQEGEKVPKYRFKEFENDGEWEIKELNELGSLINGLTYSPDDVREHGLLVLRSSNIQNGLIDLNDCVYVRTDLQGAYLSKPKDILVCVRNGSKNLIGKNAIIPKGLPVATHGAFMTVFRANNPEFVFQLFQTDFYDTQVKADLGATINSINGKNFLKYEFPIPKNPNEKNKIANCLTSVDALITAQAEKIEQLKLHKNGLMQGLFPKIMG